MYVEDIKRESIKNEQLNLNYLFKKVIPLSCNRNDNNFSKKLFWW